LDAAKYSGLVSGVHILTSLNQYIMFKTKEEKNFMQENSHYATLTKPKEKN